MTTSLAWTDSIALQDPKSLEDLTGLTELHAETARLQLKAEAANEARSKAQERGDDDDDSIPDIDDEWTFT